MTEARLSGKRIAAIFTDGVEPVEFTEPAKALRNAGAEVSVLSIAPGKVRGWNHTDWGDEFDVDLTLDRANPDDFDALLLPGGVMNPDNLRMNDDAVSFVREMVRSGKPIAAICHAPWLLVEADVVRGRTVTSYPSLRTDLVNAGANWIDLEVVVDEGIVTSRNPDDLDAFCSKLIEEVAEGLHERSDASPAGSSKPTTATSDDPVVEASEMSFPASDPPSWTGTTK